MDVTRSCLECEDGASGLWMAPPVCFAAVFRSLVVGYGVMVVDADHADGAFRLASEVDHEHVVIDPRLASLASLLGESAEPGRS